MSILARFACVASATTFAIGAQPLSPKATIDRYCVGCHSTTAKAGGLVLQNLNPDDPAAAPDTWEKVVRKLRVRYMPPAGLPRPDEQTYNSVAAKVTSKATCCAMGRSQWILAHAMCGSASGASI